MSKNEMTAVLKLTLEVDVATAITLDGQSRICNWLYNKLLTTAHKFREEYKQTQDPLFASVVYIAS